MDHKQFKKGQVVKCEYCFHTGNSFPSGNYYRAIVEIVRPYTHFCKAKVGNRDYSQDIVIVEVFSDTKYELLDKKDELKRGLERIGILVAGYTPDEIRAELSKAQQTLFERCERIRKLLREITDLEALNDDF